MAYKFSKGGCLRSRKNPGQISCEGILQGNAELVQFDRHHPNQRTGKEAFQNIQGSGFYIHSAALRFNGNIKNRNDYTC